MTTKHDALEEYKKAIRVKFEVEKGKEYSSFLIVPSRAQLRKLCLVRFRNNTKKDDLKCFELFLGFEFSTVNKNKLQSATDKFRPIENFLKGETDMSDPEAINMAAILVDYNPRPFNKFAKLVSNEIVEQELDDEVQNINRLITNDEKPVFVKNNAIVAASSKGNLKKKFGVGLLLTFGLFGAKNMIFKEKQCMQWKEDHYELVDCQSKQVGFANTKIIKPYDAIEFERKELTVCDTTTFFNDKKPVVWYSKKDNVVQFFNMDGENPENDAELKRVSKHIVRTYAKSFE